MDAYLFSITAFLAVGCQTFKQGDTSTDTETAACIKAAEITEECMYINIDCDEPLAVTCSYEDISVDSNNCVCDNGIYQAICDAGLTDSLEELEAGISCVSEGND